MTIYLSKEQRNLVLLALESFCEELKKEETTSVPVSELVKATVFQLDLLITYFDRQKEMDC